MSRWGSILSIWQNHVLNFNNDLCILVDCTYLSWSTCSEICVVIYGVRYYIKVLLYLSKRLIWDKRVISRSRHRIFRIQNLEYLQLNFRQKLYLLNKSWARCFWAELVRLHTWTSLCMDGTGIFDLPTWGGSFNPYNVSQTHLIFFQTLR